MRTLITSISLFTILLSACSGPQSSKVLDTDAQAVALFDSLTCKHGDEIVLNIADDSLYFKLKIESEALHLRETHRLWDLNGDTLQGAFLGAKWNPARQNQLVTSGVFSIQDNFELNYHFTIDIERSYLTVEINDEDEGSVFEDFLGCAALTVDGKKLAYPADLHAIAVDNTLRNADIKTTVHRAIHRDSYEEDEGYERSIDQDDMSYKITSITKNPAGEGLVGMQVHATGEAYSTFDNAMMVWDCNLSLYKVLGKWWVDDQDELCEVEYAFD